MKKLISVLLALSMVLAFAGCANSGSGDTTADTTENVTDAPTDPTPSETDAPTDPIPDQTQDPTEASTLIPILDLIQAEAPTQFVTMPTVLDLSDTTEMGMQNLKYYTGLDNADLISEAVVSEAAIGSIAFSLVLVRVKDAANAQTVAETMHAGVDPRKWVCVEADDMMTVGKDDVVMLVMISSSFAESGVTAQYFVDALSSVCGDIDFSVVQ